MIDDTGMKLSCYVIDDEPLAVELMESYVRKTPFLELKGSFYSAGAAFEALGREPVDLLFCDIQMPELSGMELARMLPARTRVIFTTAFSSYAVEGFKVNAMDYLLKPVSYQDFLTSANKALQWFEMAGNREQGHGAQGRDNAEVSAIFVKTDYRLLRLELDDILYIEGLKDYVKIWLAGRAEPVLSLMSMKALEEQLPSDRFVRVHRSYIVQPSKMSYIERGRIVFGKTRIPVSDTYRQGLQEFLERHSIFL